MREDSVCCQHNDFNLAGAASSVKALKHVVAQARTGFLQRKPLVKIHAEQLNLQGGYRVFFLKCAEKGRLIFGGRGRPGVGNLAHSPWTSARLTCFFQFINEVNKDDRCTCKQSVLEER